jgi:hypothetical protein
MSAPGGVSAAACRRHAAASRRSFAHQHGQDREPLAGALIHAGLAVLAHLGAADLGVADRAGHRPRSPTGRLLHRPVGDVEVEGANPQQFVGSVQPGTGELDASPVRRGDGALLGCQVFLPLSGDLRWEADGVDVRRQGFDLGPEQSGQGAAGRIEAGVVQRGLPLAQVVHDQVAHRRAAQPVAVHQLLDAQLPTGEPEGADGGRRVGREDAQCPQPQVEVDLLLAAAGLHPPLGVDQLDAVADGDLVDAPAFAGQQGRDPGRGDLPVHARAGRAELP